MRHHEGRLSVAPIHASNSSQANCDINVGAGPRQTRSLLAEVLIGSLHILTPALAASALNFSTITTQRALLIHLLPFAAAVLGYRAANRLSDSNAVHGWNALQSATIQSLCIGFAALLVTTLSDSGSLEQSRFLISWPGLSFVLTLAFSIVGLAPSPSWGRGDRIALYGVATILEDVATVLARNSRSTVVGVFRDSDPKTDENAEMRRACPIGLLKLVQSGGCDKVILAFPSGDDGHLRLAMLLLEAFPIEVQVYRHSAGSHLELWPPSETTQFLTIQKQPISRAGHLIKSLIDYTLSAAALIALSPLLLLIAIAIKLDSPGPVFFIQRRGGQGNRAIRVFKFRTMSVCEDGPVVQQAEVDDPRITRLGGILRRTSLDELPQLFNVLLGGMSLVGPRPHAMAHDLFYQSRIEHYCKRMRVKPGITGWAQVHNLRGNTREIDLMQARVDYDIYYVENWSLGLDLRILMKTLGVVFIGDRAY